MLQVLPALFLLASLATPPAPAAAGNDDLRKAGDVLQVLLPALAAATTVVLRDWEGTLELARASGTSLGTTYIFKYTTGRFRPDNSDRYSFPSGHTNNAFLGPGFMHRRYGWRYAVPLYAGAAFVGYTRIMANRHWADDVFAGATIAVFSTWVFTRAHTSQFRVSPTIGRHGGGIAVHISW